MLGEIVGKLVAGQIRTILAFGGGVLVAKGVDQATVTGLQGCLAEPVTGGVLWLLAHFWSAKDKLSGQPKLPAASAFDERPIIQYPR